MADILIIEDDKAIQNLLKIALKQEGHGVFAVGSAREGIDFVVKNIVDLIVLDLGLPDMDGSNVVETVRSFSETLPIIVVSARGGRIGKDQMPGRGRQRLRAEALFQRRADGSRARGASAQRGFGRTAERHLRQRPPFHRLCGAQRTARRPRNPSHQLRI